MRERIIHDLQQCAPEMSVRREPQTTTKPGTVRVEPYLSIAQAAKALGLSRRLIDNAIHDGQLAFYPIGKTARRVKLSEVIEFVEKRRSLEVLKV